MIVIIKQPFFSLIDVWPGHRSVHRRHSKQVGTQVLLAVGVDYDLETLLLDALPSLLAAPLSDHHVEST